jgi:disulfide bond formation protein DsbB
MLTLIAIVAVIVGLVAIKATARTIAIIITVTAVVVLGTANAHAAPGIGACGECTSNIIGLSADYFIALVLAVICVVSTVLVIRNDKKNK